MSTSSEGSEFPSAGRPSAVCKVVHTTCASCGAFTEYDGTRALNVRQLRTLRMQQCSRCGERGCTVIAMLSYPTTLCGLRKLPHNSSDACATELLSGVIELRTHRGREVARA